MPFSSIWSTIIQRRRRTAIVCSRRCIAYEFGGLDIFVANTVASAVLGVHGLHAGHVGGPQSGSLEDHARPLICLASMRHAAPNGVGELGSIRKSTSGIFFEGTCDDPA